MTIIRNSVGSRRLDLQMPLLRAFVAVAESGCMTSAARVVHVTQSAVSQRIGKLERQLQVILFTRRKDLVRLTRDGEKFLPRARRLIALNDEVVGDLKNADFSGEVRLGVAHDIVGNLVPPVLRRFHRSYPNILVTLVSDTSAVLLPKLEASEIDIAITTDRHMAVVEHRLFTDRLVWAGAKGGKAARQRPLSVALGRENCGFRSAAVKALDSSGISWRPICQVGSLEPVFATLEADMAVAPFLSCTVPKRLAILKRTTLPHLPSFDVNVRCSPHAQTAGTNALVALIHQELGKSLSSR